MKGLNMNNEDKLGISLTKEACPACGALVDGPIIMNTTLTQEDADEARSFHGKVIGYLDKPCNDCQDLMSKGFLLIGVDMDRTEDENNPYRSGHQWVISEEGVDKTFVDINKDLGYAFIDVGMAKYIGLPVKKFEDND